MTRLIEVELRVTDLDASARFYRDVIGVPVKKQDPHPPAYEPHYEAEWGSWDGEGEGFLLFLIYPASDGRRTTGAEIGFAVERVDDVDRRASAAGADVLEPPAPRPWGRGAKYVDPDGNVVSVTEGG